MYIAELVGIAITCHLVDWRAGEVARQIVRTLGCTCDAMPRLSHMQLVFKLALVYLDSDLIRMHAHSHDVAWLIIFTHLNISCKSITSTSVLHMCLFIFLIKQRRISMHAGKVDPIQQHL